MATLNQPKFAADESDQKFAKLQAESKRLGNEVLALKNDIANIRSYKPNKPFMSRASQLSPRDSRSNRVLVRSESTVEPENIMKSTQIEDIAISERPQTVMLRHNSASEDEAGMIVIEKSSI